MGYYSSYYFYGLGVSWLTIFVVVGLYLLFTGELHDLRASLSVEILTDLLLATLEYSRTRRDIQHRQVPGGDVTILLGIARNFVMRGIQCDGRRIVSRSR